MRRAVSAEWVQRVISGFLDDPTNNSLGGSFDERAWDDALIGFSNGADPLYEFLKRDIGSFYCTPIDLFSKTFPGFETTPHELTVISWILPQTEATKRDNRREATCVSERWARSRMLGEQINDTLRHHLVASLQDAGHEAMAPVTSKYWKRQESEKYGFASTWSERHTAYASGLGTFGLSDGLITPRGVAMRCGSVIANIQIPATPRPYRDHHEYCLFFSKGICGRCIKRCPQGAITEEGHDKVKCRNYIHPRMDEYVKSHYGFGGYGCGLCQTGVPCESKIPTPSDLE